MEEEVDSKKSKSMTEQPLSTPWLDLPDPITELILENLHLTDYLRFAAVCRQWKSIQKNHRLRFSPSQPPMSPDLPWFMPAVQSGKDSRLVCSSFNHKKYYLQGFDTSYTYHIFSCHGWILGVISGPPYIFTLVNPITTVKIHLPSLPLPEDEESPIGNWWGAMSGPPGDSDCTILLADGADVFLYRLSRGADCWTHLDLPNHQHRCLIQRSIDLLPPFLVAASTASPNAICTMSSTPLSLILQLGSSNWTPSVFHGREWYNFLVDLDGQVLLVAMPFKPYDCEPDFLRFEVFQPDLSKNVWVMVNDLGDRSLFIHDYCSFSLSAADVGCKKNCIYYPRSFIPTQYELVPGDYLAVFDLETGRLIDEKPHLIKFDNPALFMDIWEIWFLPRLDHLDLEEAFNAGKVSVPRRTLRAVESSTSTGSVVG